MLVDLPQLLTTTLIAADAIVFALLAMYFFQLRFSYSPYIAITFAGLFVNTVLTRVVFRYFPAAEYGMLVHYGLRTGVKLVEIIPAFILLLYLYNLIHVDRTIKESKDK